MTTCIIVYYDTHNMKYNDLQQHLYTHRTHNNTSDQSMKSENSGALLNESQN